jgi:hypothetical protein
MNPENVSSVLFHASSALFTASFMLHQAPQLSHDASPHAAGECGRTVQRLRAACRLRRCTSSGVGSSHGCSSVVNDCWSMVNDSFVTLCR